MVSSTGLPDRISSSENITGHRASVQIVNLMRSALELQGGISQGYSGQLTETMISFFLPMN